MSFSAAWRGVKKSSIWTTRVLTWLVVTAVAVSALTVLSLYFWILPNIDSYREHIAAAVSRAAKVRITIGRISADWEGIRPHLLLENISVFDKNGRLALGLERVESTVAWHSLPALSLHFHSLDIYKPTLDVRRSDKGVVSIAGIELQPDDEQRGGFREWLLSQPDVEVHDASVSWTDDMRRAPPLELSRAYFRMINRGRHHRFGLKGVPPKALAGPIDVRADLRGDNAALLADWAGTVYVDLASPDVPGISPWVDLPFELTRASGSVRTWVTFADAKLTTVVADVSLAGVRSRLRKDLPELDLETLQGHVTWKDVPAGFEISTTKLAFAGSGVTLPPADFLLRVTTNDLGLQEGELHANALNLPPLVMLADRLPLEDTLRNELTGYSPQGRVHDIAVRWKGAWPNVRQYSIRGRFENLAINRHGRLPGVSGLSGSIDGSEKSGTLHLVGSGATLDMPEAFSEPRKLEVLNAQLGWSRSGDRIDLRFSNVSFSNSDAAGTLSGSYRTARTGRGDIDLTGSLTRADARAIPRYIPITELRKVRPWLERAVLAGQSNDLRFRIKGRLDNWPFRDEQHGLFHLTAKITGGSLDYADHWPRFENIEGDLQFRGTRMDFTARYGTISGVKVTNVHGEIPDMTAHPEVLSIGGEAEGATPDFLAFIAASPVNDMIDRFTEGVQARGAGKLALNLVLPLGEQDKSKVSGAYVFAANEIAFEHAFAPLEQARGRIEFTENSVRVPWANGVFLGGPVSITATTQRDTLRATFQGRANIDNVRKSGAVPWLQQLRGTTDWRGTLSLRKKVPELIVESNLQGIASNLPAPFSKTAGESVPLRVERRTVNAQQDRIAFTYGDIAKGDLVRRKDGNDMTIDRGVVRFGPGETGEIDRPGLWLRGTLKAVDFDDWLTVGRAQGSGPANDTNLPIAGADVKIGELDFFNRRFNELAVNAVNQGGSMQVTLSGREVEGTATWRPEGKGRLTARLKKLNLPSGDGKPVAVSKLPAKPLELPALDVQVDQFQYGVKQLGRLELSAVHQDRDWRIERLRISNPDGVLSVEGVWQSWLTQPRTQLGVQWEVSDIGRTLTRWNFPAGVRGGTAKLEGHLSWLGSPVDFDYPTLAGNLNLEAAKGQFLKLEPGLGKLLGILSLQSLPRRISLDFRDVFSDGFAFDSIAGAIKIDRGIASTSNLRIAGPAARVAMTGDVDLAGETQRLRVRVTPHLSESVSIAGALIAGPVAGVAAFLAQKMLKDPIEQLISFEYNVTGSWSDPKVAKVERAAALAPEAHGAQ